MKTYFKNITLNFLLLLMGTIAPLAIVELTLRIAQDNKTEPKPLTDRPQVHYLPENANIKLLDHEHNPQKAEGTFRIVVVGDSFTYAGKVQYGDCFSKRLERLFNLNDIPEKLEVQKVGVPGYNTKQEAHLIKKYLKDYNPDLVILEITLNDAEIKPYQDSNKRIIKAWQDKENSFAYKNIKTYQWIAKKLHAISNNRHLKNYYLDLFKNPETLTPFTEAIITIKNLSDEFNVPVVAVTFPLLSFDLDDRYPFHNTHETIKTILAENNLRHLDLLTAFHGLNHFRMEAIPAIDGHPNEIAHRIAASTIYRWLNANQLVPKKFKAKNVIRH
jgi:lysophospholipase L1-like esterase